MHLQFYTQESLGATRSLTPEGFLLCQNVPLARTGTLLYAAGEVPVDPGPNGIISISRDPEEVFHPNSVASFSGKPITDDHPDEHVSPENWKQHAIGVVMHPRRGDGNTFDDQFLYADLLIQDQRAIRAVLDGKREVSAGYDANYEQLAPGKGRQSHIIGNHVALVDKGRCGPRCAIGDRAMATKPKNKFATFRDRIMKAHRAGDEEGVAEKVNEMIGEMISGNNGMTGDELNPSPTNEWEGAPTEKAGEKQIVINVHGQQAPGNTPLSTAAPPATNVDAGAVPGAAPAATGAAPAAGAAAAGGDPMQMIMQRLATIEQALAALAQGGEPDDPDDDTDPANKKQPPNTGDDGKMIEEGDHPEDVTEGGTGKSEPTNTGEDPGAAPKNKPTGDARGTDGNRVMTGDSRALSTGFSEMVALGTILVPDVKIPTFDGLTSRQITIDRMCAFRKSTLATAYGNPEIRPHIDALVDGQPNFKAMSCDAASAIFTAASRAVRSANNDRISSSKRSGARAFGVGPMTPADINKRNRELYRVNR